ncbi:MAG: peptide chain release factor 2 [Deltaproteobacteria bacterium]
MPLLEDVNVRLSSIEQILRNLRGYLDIEGKKHKIAELSGLMSSPEFWNDEASSSRTVKELKSLKTVVEPWEQAHKRFEELKEIAAITGEGEPDMVADLDRSSAALVGEVEAIESRTLLDGPFDPNSAYLSINSGAGGTESCDWASMLLRLYTRWAERRGFGVKTIDILYGEEAGIKNVTILIEGPYAFGYLKSERGVHRLVRISPFDANKRRHTSFASVDIFPEIEETGEIKIEEKDLVIETYRASGPGGQHMQKTDTAVRMTHKPTGIVVSSQNERSQYQNRQNVLKILKAKIYEYEQRKKEEELQKTVGTEKKKIEWGSQIRSYVLQPYQMVKDNRTDYETGNTQAVLDGEIDGFIEAYLKWMKQK